MATSTVEDYLKAIELQAQASPETLVTTGQIAAALDVAPGSATAMVKALAASGLVTYEPYNGVRLTAAGRQLAVHVLRRHRLIELFLVRVVGMDWSEVHAEAEQLEHVVSDSLIRRIDEMLEHPLVDPHGDPIPTAAGEMRRADLTSLLHSRVKVALRVAQVIDQDPEFLQLVKREGLEPGRQVEVVRRDEAAETVTLRREDGRRLSLGFGAASKILVGAV